MSIVSSLSRASVVFCMTLTLLATACLAHDESKDDHHEQEKPKKIRPNNSPGAHLPNEQRLTFFKAARNGDAKTITEMLKKEPLLVDARPDNDHRTPLIIAAWFDHAGVAKVLIANGADIEAEDYVWGGSALGWAGWDGRPNVAKVLIDAGAEVNHPNRGGCTPLCSAEARKKSKYKDQATEEEREAVIALLKKHGGVLNQKRTRPWPIIKGWDDVQ